MRKVNFTGRLIYFGYQQHDCKYDNQQSTNMNENSYSPSKSNHHTSYYRSTLSFRNDQDHYKSLNSTQLIPSNSSNENDLKLNSCDNNKLDINDEYFSYSYFYSQLSKSYQFNSRSLFDSLNLIIRILRLNLIDCKTLRLKQMTKKLSNSYFAAVNIYTTRKSSSNQLKKQIELVGKYSNSNDEYQSCQTDKRKDLSRIQKSSSSRIYYITSLFDEPFLMLRKRTALHIQFNQPRANFNELRGRVFDFHELEGFCVDLAEKVCSILNITCQFRIVHDGGFGSKNETTGIWNG